MLLLFLILNNYYVKDIKDYIGKKQVAIYCSTQNEWESIAKLLNRNTSMGYPGMGDCFVIKVNGNNTNDKSVLERQNFTIYPASDFLEDDILEQCNKKYPIGTKYRCPIGNTIVEVKGKFFKGSTGNEFTDGYGGYVYYEGKFAEIIEEESKFEVGKWYKYSYKNNHYFKPLESIVLGKSVKTSEEIHTGIYKNTTNTWSSTNETKLADLSEIQQYLPNGHLDKIIIPEYVELLPGFDTPLNGKIFSTKGPQPKGWKYSSWEQIVNISFKQYFKPSTKEAYEAQFVKELEKQWIPQAGDWAYRLDKGSSINKVTKGKVYLVLEGSSAKELKIIDDSGNKDNFDTYRFRKALPSEIPKQSYVKCISTKSTEFTLNKIYKVESDSIRTNTGYLCMDNIRNNLSNYYSCSFEYSTEQEYLIQQGKQVHEKVVSNIQVGKSYPIIDELPIEQQSIKQYPLTKEECFIDLKNTKIWIGDNPELSRKVQEKASKLGSKWINENTKIDCLDEYFLLFDEKGNISRTGYLDKIYFNICKEKKQIKLTELEIPKPIKVIKREENYY